MKKYLQGICTSDVSKLAKKGDCQATLFLHPKGRVLADALLYHIDDSKESPAVLVETSKDNAPSLEKFLGMYKLRSKVTIQSENQTKVILHTENFLEPSSCTNGLPLPQSSNSYLMVRDPRSPWMGVRELYKSSPSSIPPSSSPSSSPSPHTHQSPHSILSSPYHSRLFFDRYRYLLCLVEGGEGEGRIPLEMNYDLLNYIAFNKGCYVGQELVARTKFKGLIRKRVVPFLISSQLLPSPSPSPSSPRSPSLHPSFPTLPPSLAQYLLTSDPPSPSSSLPSPTLSPSSSSSSSSSSLFSLSSQINEGDVIKVSSLSSLSPSSSSAVVSCEAGQVIAYRHIGGEGEGGEGGLPVQGEEDKAWLRRMMGIEGKEGVSVLGLGLALVRLEYVIPPSSEDQGQGQGQAIEGEGEKEKEEPMSDLIQRQGAEFVILPGSGRERKEGEEGGAGSSDLPSSHPSLSACLFRPPWWPDLDPHTGKPMN